MVRRGWTKIEVPERWTQLIRGRHLLRSGHLRITAVRILRSAICQPLHRRVIHRHKSRRCTHRRRVSPRWTVSSLRCRRWGPRIQISFGGSNQDCEGRSTETSSSTTESCRSSTNRLEAALALLGEHDPDAEPLKVALSRQNCRIVTSNWRTSQFVS